MKSDPIVAEIRKLREQRAARFGYDISLIVKDARNRDVSGDREVVRRAPRRPVATSTRVAGLEQREEREPE